MFVYMTVTMPCSSTGPHDASAEFVFICLFVFEVIQMVILFITPDHLHDEIPCVGASWSWWSRLVVEEDIGKGKGKTCAELSVFLGGYMWEKKKNCLQFVPAI